MRCIWHKEKAGDCPGLFLCGYPVATLTDLRKVVKVSTAVGFVVVGFCFDNYKAQSPEMQ